MSFYRHTLLMLVAAMGLVGAGVTAQAATIVKVNLWDDGAGTPMATDLVYGKPAQNDSKPTMGIQATPSAVPAGIVSFQVTNTSKDTIHEMIVMYLKDPTKPLPYIASENRVDEDKAGDKGEVSELDPGKQGTLTVALRPGKYLLICNVAGHYAAGMWTTFEVTK